MDQITSFGEWLRRRRRALDLTQAELADRAGCVAGTIKSIEADARRPSKQLAERLAEVLQLAQDERAPFLRAARAELSPDQLAPPSRLAEPARSDAADLAQERGLQTGLPSGAVTFLMTDIEASTQLWEQQSQAMQTALARHDALLQQAVTAAGGVVVKSTGDGMLAAFAHAGDALAAALNAQRSLQQEAWNTVAPLRVRMALHTGVAEERAGDYFGAPLNRIARLCAVGHGGQILLSRATWELLADHLPPDVELHDLGVHQLKDLSRPEHIYQLIAPDLPANFPKLHTLDLRRTNLPTPATPLLGRDQLQAELSALARRAEIRLVTLTGPGGTGKTRLAIQLGADLLDAFPDGVWFVDLAPIRDPDMVIPTIAQTLGLKEQGEAMPIEQLKIYLRNKLLLLLLDNFEQVVDAAPQVAELLGATPQLKVLSTSRMALKLRGEQEIEVPRLDLPDMGRLPDLATLSQYAAVALFIERAQAVKRDFAATNANAPAIAQICYQLDGLPLAIELAAARVKLFPPEALLKRLERRLPLLTGGARDLPARQQTMRHTIAWSYDLLSKAEQILFQRLGVFVGGCTVEAAEAVCNAAGELEIDVLDGLAALAEKSLLRQGEGRDGEPRFVMLETIREYALEQIVAHGEADDIRKQHASYFLDMAEKSDSWDVMTSEHLVRMARLQFEHDNLRTALEWFRECEDAEYGLRLAAALKMFWVHRFHWREGRAWLETPLTINDNITQATRAKALVALAQLIHHLGDAPAARTYILEGLALLRRLDDSAGIALALLMLGNSMLDTTDFATARACAEECLTIFEQIDDPFGRLHALQLLGHIAAVQGDIAQAILYTEEILPSYRKLDSKRGIGGSLIDRGVLAQLQDDWEQAMALYTESLSIARELGDKWMIALCLTNLGGAALHQGSVQWAAACFAEGLTISQDIGYKYGLAMNLAGIAGVMAMQKQPERSAYLFGAAETLFDAMGMNLELVDRIEYDRNREIAQAQLDEATFAAAWAEGQAMTLEQAVEEALAAGRDTLRDDQ